MNKLKKDPYLLIADGGSTKCDWALLDSGGELVWKAQTQGLNPTVFAPAVLQERLSAQPQLNGVRQQLARIDFYGAGCGTPGSRAVLQGILENFAPGAVVRVAEDLLAAARAVTREPGIVCILGTGSNSCFFDGQTAHAPIPSLGYALMDDGSGNYFGKQLLRDYFYKQMPSDMATRFAERFDLTPDTIKENLYHRKNPNAYLASFAEFLFTETSTPYFEEMLHRGLELFIHNQLRCHPQTASHPIHFVGSVAYFAREIICALGKKHGLDIGNFVRRPMDGLVAFYESLLE